MGSGGGGGGGSGRGRGHKIGKKGEKKKKRLLSSKYTFRGGG